MATQKVKIEYVVDKSPLKGANAELDEMIKNNSQLTEKAKKTSKELKNQGKEADGLNGTLKKTAGVLAAVFAADKIIDFGKEVFRVRGEMQRFSAVLTNTLGSKSAAQKALQQIRKFAAETPFSVSQLTASFVKLANQGFKPTANEMRKLGDLASSTGKEFDQLAEAIIDAQTGEFERLKEFGIRASKQGDQVKFTFKGVETQTKFTSEAIKDYVLSLGDLQGVSGAMAAISTTLEGRISNLGDSYETLLNSLGERGQGIFAGAISVLGDLVNATNEWIELPTSEKILNEKDELNVLIGALNTSNISEEVRLDLIRQINTLYPNFLKGINLEKVSNKELQVALEDVNKEYEKKIKIALGEEGLTDLQKDRNELIEEERKLIRAIAQLEISRENNLKEDKGSVARAKAAEQLLSINRLEKERVEITKERAALDLSIKKQEKKVEDYYEEAGIPNPEQQAELEEAARESEKKIAKARAEAKIEAQIRAAKGIKDAEDLAKESGPDEFDFDELTKELDDETDLRIEKLLEQEEKKQEIRDFANEVMEQFKFDTSQADSDRDAADLERKRAKSEAELQLANNLAGSIGDLIGRETAFGKAASIAQATINVAQGVTKAFAQGGIGGFVTGALVAAAGAKSIATIVSTPTPKFREGGYISGNSHDYGGVNIEAEGGEYMARRESVNKYGRSFFESLNNMEIHPDVISGISGGSSPIIVKSDNSELINEYRNRPINNISISEEGITLRTKRNNSIVQKKVKRYTT